MVHKIEVPGTDPGAAPVEPGEAGEPHQFGLNAAMALIVGSIIGGADLISQIRWHAR